MYHPESRMTASREMRSRKYRSASHSRPAEAAHHTRRLLDIIARRVRPHASSFNSRRSPSSRSRADRRLVTSPSMPTYRAGAASGRSVPGSCSRPCGNNVNQPSCMSPGPSRAGPCGRAELHGRRRIPQAEIANHNLASMAGGTAAPLQRQHARAERRRPRHTSCGQRNVQCASDSQAGHLVRVRSRLVVRLPSEGLHAPARSQSAGWSRRPAPRPSGRSANPGRSAAGRCGPRGWRRPVVLDLEAVRVVLHRLDQRDVARA